MTWRIFGSPSLAVMALASPSLAADKASAVLKDAQGNEVGSATLTTLPNGVLIGLDLTALPPASTPSISMRSAHASRPTSSRQAPISIPRKTSTA